MPNELEAIFRRGSEWEAGVELVVALALQASRRLCLKTAGLGLGACTAAQ